MGILEILIIIERLATLAGKLKTEDRVATPEELEQSGLGAQSALDRLMAEIKRQREEAGQ